jgi:hypothetical protein
MLLLGTAAAQEPSGLRSVDPAGIRALEVDAYRALVTVTSQADGPITIRSSILDYDLYATTGESVVLSGDAPLGQTRRGKTLLLEGPPVRELIRIEVQAPPDLAVRVRIEHFADVTVSGRAGSLEVSQFQGRVELDGQTGAASVSILRDGSIVADLPGPRPGQSYAFSVFRGSIDLRLPRAVRALLALESFEGSVASDPGIRPAASPDEGALILATNVKGNIRVYTAPTGEEAEP